MPKSSEITADLFEEKEPTTVSSESSVSSVKNTMENENLRAVPVVNPKNQLQGIVGYRDLIRRMQFNPKTTKLEKVMHNPPEYSKEDNLIELCELRINSGKKMLARTDQHEHLEAVIGDKEYAAALKDADEIEKISTEDLSVTELFTTFEKDSIDEARHLMLDENVSRLPVLDKNGKMTGILRSTDVLKALVPRESQDAGGTAGNREGSEMKMSGGGEKESMSSIPVREIMESQFNGSTEHLQGDKAIEKMIEKNAHELVFLKDRYPQSIITLKDFMKYISGFAPGSTILVSITGLETPEEKAAVHRAVKRQLQGSLGRKIKRPEELKIHVKKSEKDGKRHRYELNFKLFSEYGMVNVETEGWELVDSVDEALEQLNSKIRKEKGKRTDY